MKIRTYLTFNGNCNDALALYSEAFQTETIQALYFKDLPEPARQGLPEEYLPQVVQATLKMGDDFIRLSDCGPGTDLNDASTEKISVAVEADIEFVKSAFAILAKDGEVGMELNETFYSPCAGVVFDKFGVMWNFVSNQ